MIESKIISDMENERAVLVGLITPQQNETKANEYLDELAFLADTAGAVTVKKFLQRCDAPNRTSFVGKGKLEEIAKFVEDNDIALVIFDDDLSTKQVSFIEKEVKAKVLDRTSLILDIFAARAKTANAKMQVELAQYQYLLPRLTRMWTHLERQRGGIGMLGPGETQIETDRRIILDKISLLKERLRDLDKQKTMQRKNRGKLTRIALVGYTNVGKSTLMNMLGLLDVVTSGTYILNGKDVSDMDDDELSDIRNREIGFIFQGFNLIPSLTAQGNVELPLIYRGMKAEERHKLSTEALKRVGLEKRMEHLPNQMSGGQQQRVAIARAVAAKPPVILADEPTGNLDSTSGKEVMRIINELWAEGRTVILITHDDSIAESAHRVIRISDGKIVDDYTNENITPESNLSK